MTLKQQAMEALKAGQKETARNILLKALEVDENDEQAWLIMAGAVTDPMEQRICLENVLHLNPDNARAKQGLAWMRKTHPVAFEDESPPIEAVPAAATGQTIVLTPEQPTATTGPTVVLTPEQPIAQPEPPRIEKDLYVPPMQGAVLQGAETMPCPACGTSTNLKQKRCPTCKIPLTQRVAGPTKMVLAKIAGILGLIHTFLFYILLVGGLLIFVVSAWSKIKKTLLEQGATETYLDQAYQQSGLGIITTALGFIFLFGLFMLFVCIKIMQGRKWAYWVGLIYFTLQALYTVGQAISANSQIDAAEVSLQAIPNSEKIVGALRAFLVIMPIWMLAIVILLIVSYKEFQGRRVRLLVDPDLQLEDAEAHFNLGVNYRKRKYWYMAMREWEKAVSMAPQDPTYHHALGIMYEHLKRPADALREFDVALQIAPEQPAIMHDRHRLAAQLSGQTA